MLGLVISLGGLIAVDLVDDPTVRHSRADVTPKLPHSGKTRKREVEGLMGSSFKSLIMCH